MFVKKQLQLYPEKRQCQLQHLSDIRWVCRYSSVDAVRSTLDSLITTLEDQGKSEDIEKAVLAIGIFLQDRSFEFLPSLIVFY